MSVQNDATDLRVARVAGATHSALLGGAIAAIASFIVFLAMGAEIATVLMWMGLFGLLAFSGTYIGVAIADMVSSRRH